MSKSVTSTSPSKLPNRIGQTFLTRSSRDDRTLTMEPSSKRLGGALATGVGCSMDVERSWAGAFSRERERYPSQERSPQPGSARGYPSQETGEAEGADCRALPRGAQSSRARVPDKRHDVGEIRDRRGFPPQPVENLPVLTLHKLPVCRPIGGRQARISMLGEGNQVKVQLQHAASAAPPHSS